MSQKIANPTDSAVAENNTPATTMLANENEGRNPNPTADAVKNDWGDQTYFINLKNEEFRRGIRYNGF